MLVVTRIPVIQDDQVDLFIAVMSADSTIVGAHQQAAGARKGVGDPKAISTVPQHTRAPSNDKYFAVEPADHALGRSRGGLSTKIRAHRPGDPAGDNPQLLPLIEVYQRWYRPGRGHRFRLLADNAYLPPVDPAGAAPQ